jgi:hypothetical protein
MDIDGALGPVPKISALVLDSNVSRRADLEGHDFTEIDQYFGDIFEICNRTITLTDDQKLKSIIAEGRKFYKADMEARGIPP